MEFIKAVLGYWYVVAFGVLLATYTTFHEVRAIAKAIPVRDRLAFWVSIVSLSFAFAVALAWFDMRDQRDARSKPIAIYREMSDDIRSEVSRKLKLFLKEHPGVQILVMSDFGAQREMVAKDLAGLLRNNGFVMKEPSPRFGDTLFEMRGEDVNHTIQITYSRNPNDEWRLAESLALALNPYVKAHFVLRYHAKLLPGHVTIDIFGEPLFLLDGSFVFQ